MLFRSIDEAIATVKGKAKEGALEAVPQIKAAIEPYVYASLLMGAGGLLFGFAAYRRTRMKGAALSGARSRGRLRA